MSFAYLFVLLLSILCMVAIDYRCKLAFFHDARRSALTIGVAVLVFIVWDIAGIALNIFYSPDSPYVTGWYFAPHFPVEELFFLIFLSYFTLVTYLLGAKLWPRI